MAYKIIVAKEAALQIENILDYVMYQLKNKTASRNIMLEINSAYTFLSAMPNMFPVANDRHLAANGYRKYILKDYSYVIIYRVVEDEVHVNGVFHMLENYADKL